MRYWRDLQITKRQAVALLIAVHVVISLYWLSQAGFFLIKDSSVYLAIAKRAAEIPFFTNPYDQFPATNFILTNGPFYAYLINALQKLPGGFAPYHFLMTQLLHLALVLSVFFTVTLWRSPKWALVVALLGMLEPLHYMDILAIKPSIFTQPTVGIGVCLAACGWKLKRYDLFVWAALVLGVGTIFRPFNIAFVPLLLLLALLTGSQWGKRLLAAGAVIAVTVLSMQPRLLFNRANPDINVEGFDLYFLFVSNRLEQTGMFNADYIPQTMEYYYNLAPRLRDASLVEQHQGSSLHFYEAFRHERVYQYGDTPAQAERYYHTGGRFALAENPRAYIVATVKTFLRNWGISVDPLVGYDYQLLLWSNRPADEPFFTRPPYGNTLLRMFACPAPFETCLEQPEPDLLPKDLIASLQSMPRPHLLSNFIGEAWERVSPFKGVVALALLLVSLVWLALRREWEILFFWSSVIGTYLVVITFLVIATTYEIVLVLPWIAWMSGMAASSPTNVTMEVPQLTRLPANDGKLKTAP